MDDVCATCRNTRHVVGGEGTGFKRCPDCFLQSSLERVLVSHGYPKIWAHASVERIESILGSDHAVVGALRSIAAGTSGALHFYGGPSESREMIFAATVRGFLTNSAHVNVLDTAELAPKHFEKDRQISRLKPAPTIITVGKEIERKLGSFYLRNTLEFSVPRRLPVVLFSDTDIHGLNGYYGDFTGLYTYARFVSIAIP